VLYLGSIGGKAVRITRLLYALGLLAVTIGFGPGGLAAATLPGPQASPAVDPQVWADLAAAADHRVRFVVSMQETPDGGPASAVSAQMALEEPLAMLQRLGTVASSRVYYGSNATVVEGGPGAVRFLAEWPEVASIGPYRAGAPWETARSAQAQAATGHITGMVTGPDGATPLAGIRVRTYLWLGGPDWLLAAWTDSGADGRYDIGGLASGYYRAMFIDLAGNYVTEYYDDQSDWSSATTFSVTDGAITPGIDASLARAGKISGKVTAQGSGVADVVVSAWAKVGGTWRNRGSDLSINNGNYTIDGIAEGAYAVMFSDGLSPQRYLTEYYNNVLDINQATPVSVVAGQTTGNINASLGGYGKITGKVTAPDGTTGLEDITVDLYEYNATDQIWDWASFGTTDASGNYEVGGLVTRDYRVGFSDPLDQYIGEFYNDKATVEAGDNVHVELGSTTANINASLALPTITLELGLANGWNLLALPLTLSDPAPASAFGSIQGAYSLVYAYDGCVSSNQWKSYNPNIPPVLNTLTAVDAKQGLWLQTTSPATLRLTGVPPISTAINLCTGWNLIGYPSATAKSVSTALAGISGKYNLVYAYDAADATDPWKSYNPSAPPYANDLTEMKAGLGYWIRMTSPGTLTVPGH
jgi:major membrane immunogen (membrane-anchored lipoprotein)